MSYPPSEIQANLAEQLDWRYAERDDQAVAQALVSGSGVDGVHTLDEIGLLDGLFAFLQASGVLKQWHSFEIEAVQRVFLPTICLVLLYGVRLLFGIESNNALPALLFSNVDLAFDKLIDYYRLRFQIEFNFRDAKQFWGLEDFMNINQTPVYNAANLAMFMVNVSRVLIRHYQPTCPTFSVNDLKARFRGHKYVTETLKLLPQLPEPIFIDHILANIAQIGSINTS